jgi:serine/threonine protein kinase
MTVHEGALLCGRYRLQQSVGRGGMADVYLAFDNKRQAPVAVKILREDMAEDPDFVRRFHHEAEALARLDHPNIVRFYAFEQDGLVAFIVMDYIAGTTLRSRVASPSNGETPPVSRWHQANSTSWSSGCWARMACLTDAAL